MEINVYSLNRKYLGTASSFGAAKRMQQDSLPDDLKDLYAGYQEGGPLFYTEMLTPALMDKYPQLDTRRKSA